MHVASHLVVAGCALLGATLFGTAATLAADFTWSASNRCPAEQEVREAVERGLGAKLTALPEIAFEAHVREPGGAYELELKARKGKASLERHIRTKTCAETVDVLVAAMSLALESLGAERKSDESRPGSAPTDPTPSETPAPPIPAEAPKPAKAESAPKRSAITAFVAAAPILEVGTLPGAAWGGALSLGLGLGRWNLRAFGAFTPKARSDLGTTSDGYFDWLAGGLGGCYLPFRGSWELRGCVDGELGRLRGRGNHVRNPQDKSVLWLAIVPGFEGVVRPGGRGWGVFARAGAPIPLYRKSFAIGDAAVHTPAPIGVRAAIGIELQFM